MYFYKHISNSASSETHGWFRLLLNISPADSVTKISAEDMKICWLVLANQRVQYLDLFRFEHTIIIVYVTVKH